MSKYITNFTAVTTKCLDNDMFNVDLFLVKNIQIERCWETDSKKSAEP